MSSADKWRRSNEEFQLELAREQYLATHSVNYLDEQEGFRRLKLDLLRNPDKYKGTIIDWSNLTEDHKQHIFSLMKHA